MMWSSPLDDKIYAAGGISQEGGQPLDTIEVFDISDNKWTALESMNLMLLIFREA